MIKNCVDDVTFYLTRPSFLVQPLDVTLLTDADGRVYVALDEL